jgi:hypothetical protein
MSFKVKKGDNWYWVLESNPFNKSLVTVLLSKVTEDDKRSIDYNKLKNIVIGDIEVFKCQELDQLDYMNYNQYHMSTPVKERIFKLAKLDNHD